MAFWIVNPVNGNDETGASGSNEAVALVTPFKTTGAISPVSGDFVGIDGNYVGRTVSQAAGVTWYAINRDSGMDGQADINALEFGTGTTGVNNITVDGLYLTDAADDGVSISQAIFLRGDEVTHHGSVLKRLTILNVSDTALTGAGQGMRIYAAGTTVQDCRINTTSDDNVYCQGSDLLFQYNTFLYPDNNTNFPGGDCLKFSQAGVSANCISRNNYFVQNRARKSCQIIEGPNGLCESSFLSGGIFPASIRGNGSVFRRNRILGAAVDSYPAWPESPVSFTRAVNMDGYAAGFGDSQVLESNIIMVSGVGSPTTGVGIFGGQGKVIRGNTIYGTLQAGATRSYIQVGNGVPDIPANVEIYNNIVGGESGQHLVNSGGAAGTAIDVCDYNIYLNDGSFQYNGSYYGSFAAWQASGLGFDQNSWLITDDGLTVADVFVDAASGDFRLKDSFVAHANFPKPQSVSYKDYLGRTHNSAPLIGAYAQAASQTPIQNPQWGVRSTEVGSFGKFVADVMAPSTGTFGSRSVSSNRNVSNGVLLVNATGNETIYNEGKIIVHADAIGSGALLSAAIYRAPTMSAGRYLLSDRLYTTNTIELPTSGQVNNELTIQEASIQHSAGDNLVAVLNITGNSIEVTTDTATANPTGTRNDDTSGAGVLPDPWIESQVVGSDYTIGVTWVNVADNGDPELVTQYDNQNFALDTAITPIDVSDAWSGVDPNSYTATNLPPGLTISPQGVISGTPRYSSIIGTTIECVGLDGQKVSSGFTWYKE